MNEPHPFAQPMCQLFSSLSRLFFTLVVRLSCSLHEWRSAFVSFAHKVAQRQEKMHGALVDDTIPLPWPSWSSWTCQRWMPVEWRTMGGKMTVMLLMQSSSLGSLSGLLRMEKRMSMAENDMDCRNPRCASRSSVDYGRESC